MSTAVETRQAKAAKMTHPPRPHPPYPEMVRQAISELRDSSGSSKAAIQRFIATHYSLGNNENMISSNVRLALKRGVERGVLVQVSGSEMDGSFKLADRKENNVSSLKDKKNVNSEKTKPAGLEIKGPTSVKKSNVEKKAKAPTPVEPTAKKAKATRTPNALKGAKPTCARPKSIKKATAVKQK
ncbi:hypothetical protein KIN20_002184 [Parelaphostrongylus tenuis]|uniref:H15 domain-containing protein n=1 Tax=Parelaphostrongylus tenuis TaxID=148309 RepID=A0AAD5QF45_PARTN|nr:hypothetical protein KIN20_002184 [Parelaphostrongylus tenuis]